MPSEDQSQLAASYDAAAVGYSIAWQKEDVLPQAKLENEVIGRLLGDCTGYRILDLGGGSGGHARQAIQAGASHIDVVDFSQGMMDVGKKIEDEAGRQVINWHLGDAYKPITQQVPSLPENSYDLVLVAWTFDNVANIADLEGAWRNVANYLKPAGRFVGIRVANPWAESAKHGKYGARLNDIKPIADGASYTYTIFATPPFTLDGSSMRQSFSGSTELPEKVGLTSVKDFDISETETIRTDPVFWDEFVKDPYFVGFSAVKS